MTNKPISEEKYLMADAVVAMAERISSLEQQLAAERARVVRLPPIYPCLCANSDIVDGNHAGQRSYREDVIEALKAAKIPVEGE
ncbi:hypothetical protein [Candidatus Symbiopectobacterium sp. NZEC135]|uniref:hypothetical protein n=1 Tax=Candidatus Symbiopectobacterium sp. NZEC135 TaxID=2820471 RepID=UPI0022277BAC|nr:hypothetical protein [Candidatus Symbiopectobacterium sp. NZEC135]MCW2477702.1 hypothetical protein [Candidatus Symbiopectobacterium sp. NZEC135]